MAEFTITFRTRAELEGAQAALTALEKQVGAAKAAGKPFEELAAKADKARAAIQAHVEAQQQVEKAATAGAQQQAGYAESVKGAGKALEATGKATRDAAGEYGNLGKLAQGLGATFPQLAQALRTLVNPFTAIAAVVGVAVSAIRSWAQQVNEAVQTQLLSQMLDGQITSLERLTAQFARSTAEFKTKLAEIATGSQTTSQALETMNQKISASVLLQDRLKDAQAAYEKAEVQRKVALGKMTPGQAAIEEGKIEARSLERKKTAEIDTARREVESTGYAVKVQEGVARAAQASIPADETLGTAKRAAELKGKEAKDANKAFEDNYAKVQDKVLDLQYALGYVQTKGGLPLEEFPRALKMDIADIKALKQRTPAETEAAVKSELDAAEKELAALLKNKELTARQSDNAQAKFESLNTQRTTGQARAAEAETELQTLKTRHENAKARFTEVKKLVPQIHAYEQGAKNLENQTKVEQAQEAASAEVGQALENNITTGAPIPTKTQNLIAAGAAEAEAAKPKPSPRPGAALPRRQSVSFPTDQDRELAAQQAGQSWMAEEAGNAALAKWKGQSQQNEARYARPAGLPGDGSREIETLGAQIVRELTQNTDVTTKNFRLFLEKIQDQNRQLSTLGYKVETLENRWKNRE